MANHQIVRIPGYYRHVFADSNYWTVEIPAGTKQLDIVFEDTNSKSVLGVVVPGYELSGAPAASATRAAAWTLTIDQRSAPRVISLALAASHAVSVIVS